MQLDIRIPIGLLFGIIGTILMALGVWTKYATPDIYRRSLGVNVNFYWGAVLMIFAVLMLLLANRASKREAAAGPK
jgi:multisubunit Na+/H+ antiporter MnhG subunit